MGQPTKTKDMKKVRTLNDIKNDPRIDEIFSEVCPSYGQKTWWAYCKAGWQFEMNQCHTAHEDTIKDLCDYINGCLSEWADDPDLTK